MTHHIALPAVARRVGTLASLLALGACDLDIANPNAATEEGVLNTAAGLRAVAIGMQGRLGNAVEEGIFIAGLVSGEIGTTNATQSTQREFQRFPNASVNVKIEPTNLELFDLWSKHYGVVKAANDILDNVDRVTLAPGTRTGMLSLARLHKAIAFGTLIEAFERIPIAINLSETPPFVERAAVLDAVLALLDSAETDATGTALSAEFTGSILAPGLALLNTIRAMQARYAIAAGDYAEALAFANEVPTGVSSMITYSALDPNPLRATFHSSRFFGAISSFRTTAEPGDTRVGTFTTDTAVVGFGGATLVALNVYRNLTDPIPLFTQDELTLIRAEAYARLDQLPEARTEVNTVRRRAGLLDLTLVQLPTRDAILAEIFRQRTYSLFLSGLHWADQRRFGRIDEAKVAYLPYPFAERATNPNTPADPPQV